jgi:hypothetical protein
MIRYFGKVAEVTIANDIEILRGCCFDDCEAVLEVIVEHGFRLSHIERRTFSRCSSL